MANTEAQRFARVGGVLSYFTRHSTAANLLLVVMLAAGLMAFPKMRAQFFPDVIIDNVNVYANWDGAGAEDIDRAIVQLLEPVLLAVEGVTDTVSTSNEGSARIVMDFEPGWDMERAADDVRLAVETVTDLPEDVDEPTVRRGAWRDRVTDVVVSGPVGVDQLGRFADELVARLYQEGVTRTTIRGVAAPETVVEVRSANLVRYDLTMQQIATAIAAEAEADPAGDVSSVNTRVRTGVAKTAVQDLNAIVLRTNADGSNLTIGDVATVTEGSTDRERAYFVADVSAISIRVDRSPEGDAIDIQGQVEEVAAALEAELPQGVKIELIRTRAEAITGRLNILMENALMGLALVVGLLFLFLNARTAFWVAAGIPVALTAAIAMMYAFGFTINMVSLFGLIITLGIVVDDAIVVGEHADARARKLGEGPYEAAENAAKRMFPPVFSATITTVIAFFGLTAVGGRFGDLIIDIPFTVIVVLIASLIECFLILPSHMAHSLKERRVVGISPLRVLLGLVGVVILGLVGAVVFALAVFALLGLVASGSFADWLDATGASLVAELRWSFAALLAAVLAVVVLRVLVMGQAERAVMVRALSKHGIDTASGIVNAGFRWVREALFRPFIKWVIWARYPVIAGAVTLLMLQTIPLVTGDLPWRFFNAPERGSISGNFAMSSAATREDTMVMMREMQRATEAVATRLEQEHGVNPVTFVMAEVGGTTGRGLSGVDTKEDYQLGSIAIELVDADSRPFSSRVFLSQLQDEVRRTPLTEVVSFRSWRSGPQSDGVDIQIYGASNDNLKAAAEDLKGQLAQFGEVSALEDSLAYDKEELILDLTPQGQALGFTIDDLGRVLRHRLGGIEAATYPVGPRSGAIRVELPEGELTADFLERTRMRTSAGEYVALADLVSVTSRAGFASVRRENGLQVVNVTGDLSEDDPARAAEIMEVLEAEILPNVAETHSVAFNLSGLSEDSDQFLADVRVGLTLCLVGIYACLAWIFASWTRPVVVMAVIPFGLIGALYGHMAWDVPLSMFSVVGLIGMTGIIINDSIVLVTTIDEHARTKGTVPAIIDGVTDRLRAVLLTTLTTVLGLTPLLYEGSSQAEFLKPTVISLVYGLGFGMVLVLMVVPALVAMQGDFRRQFGALRHALVWRPSGRAVTVPVFAALAGVGAAFVLTLGWFVATGGLPATVAGLLAGDATLGTSLVLFLGGAGVWVLAVFLVSAMLLPLTARRPVQPAE